MDTCKRCAVIDKLVALTKRGDAPNLVYDDNGHWAVSGDGCQTVSAVPSDATITVFVKKRWWKDGPLEAIQAYLKRAH